MPDAVVGPHIHPLVYNMGNLGVSFPLGYGWGEPSADGDVITKKTGTLHYILKPTYKSAPDLLYTGGPHAVTLMQPTAVELTTVAQWKAWLVSFLNQNPNYTYLLCQVKRVAVPSAAESAAETWDDIRNSAFRSVAGTKYLQLHQGYVANYAPTPPHNYLPSQVISREVPNTNLSHEVWFLADTPTRAGLYRLQWVNTSPFGNSFDDAAATNALRAGNAWLNLSPTPRRYVVTVETFQNHVP